LTIKQTDRQTFSFFIAILRLHSMQRGKNCYRDFLCYTRAVSDFYRCCPAWQPVGWLSGLLPRCIECRRGLAMRKLSVRLSVRPSVCQTRGLWQKGRKICPDYYTIRKII